MALNSRDKKELEHSHNVLDLGKYTSSFESARQKLRHGEVDAAIEELSALVMRGDSHAHTLLGIVYEHGRGNVGKDQAKAAFHYASAIDQAGAVESWLGLARISMYGDADMRDYATAERCYRALTEDANHPVAWLGLGRIYRYGYGVESDLAVAKDYFSKAANLGNIPACVELVNLLKEEGRYSSALYWKINLIHRGISAVFKKPPSELLRQY